MSNQPDYNVNAVRNRRGKLLIVVITFPILISTVDKLQISCLSANECVWVELSSKSTSEPDISHLNKISDSEKYFPEFKKLEIRRILVIFNNFCRLEGS